MAAVEPEVVAIFVDDENLGGDAEGQSPFPLGHERLGGADDAGQRVSILRELTVEAAASAASAVISDAVQPRSFGSEAARKLGVAGDQIDGDFLAPGFAESRY